MFYIVESSKSFYEASYDLEPVVQRLGFVVLHTANIGEILGGKEIDFDEECQIFDILNYRYAARILTLDLRFSLQLPWRIALFTEGGVTKIGLSRPAVNYAGLVLPAELAQLLREIEEKMILIVDEVR